MIYYFDELDSTNNKAKEMAKNGAPHGTAIVARKQTEGKGRLGRVFYSPVGGLYMSIIIRQDQFPHNLKEWATLHASVCVCKTIENITGTKPGVKWVNDIYLEDKKICGILTESSSAEWAVIGIGLNVLQPIEDYPFEIADIAGAIYRFTETPPDMDLFLSVLIPLLLDPPKDTKDIVSEYRARLHVIRRKLVVSGTGTEPFEAIATDLTDNGHLIVEKENGERVELRAGEICVLGNFI